MSAEPGPVPISPTAADPLRRRPSMADVARLAAVSTQTVSRVANGYPGVSERARQQVLSAMADLGYRPNSAARALKSGHFQTVGVVMSTLSTIGSTRTLEAITNAAQAEGYAITLLRATPSQQDGGAFSRLDEQVVDALVIVQERHPPTGSRLTLPPGLPVVVADSGFDDRIPVVDTDQAGGARSAVVHLLDLGHATVWHVAGPDDSSAARTRQQSWRATVAEHGVEPPDPLVGDWSAESGYRAGRRLAADPSCTAVFAANDHMALGVLRAMHEAGRRVPAEVSVVGFDDVPEASSFLPPLTTVRQSFAEVGRRCVAHVLAQIRGERPERGVDLVPTELVVRSSTAPPPTATAPGP